MLFLPLFYRAIHADNKTAVVGSYRQAADKQQKYYHRKNFLVQSITSFLQNFGNKKELKQYQLFIAIRFWGYLFYHTI